MAMTIADAVKSLAMGWCVYCCVQIAHAQEIYEYVDADAVMVLTDIPPDETATRGRPVNVLTTGSTRAAPQPTQPFQQVELPPSYDSSLSATAPESAAAPAGEALATNAPPVAQEGSQDAPPLDH